MASNEIVLKIKTVGGKQVLELADNTRRVRNETEKASAAQTKLGQSAERAGKSQSSVFHAKNARDMKQLREEIGGGNNGLVGAYATLAVNTFAVVAAFTALQKATGAAKLIAGLEAQGARLGRTLSLTAQNIREITDSAMSMADAMRSTAQLTAGGFDSSQIGALAAVAKDASGALGRDLADSMDRLSRGVTKLEPELLDEIGIMTKLDEASNKYAVSMNKSAASLTAAEKRQAFMNAVLEEGQRKFGGIGDQVSEYNSYTKLAAAATDNFNASIGILASALSPLAEFLATNKFAFFAAIALFAASIREQLVPALTGAVDKQKELVSESKKMVKNRFTELGESSSIVEKMSPKSPVGTGAAQMLNLARSSEEAGFGLKNFQRNYESLNAEIAEGNDLLNNKNSLSKTGREEALVNLGILRENKQELKSLNKEFHLNVAEQAQLNVAQAATSGNFKQVAVGLKEQFHALQKGSLGLHHLEENANGVASNMTALGATLGNVGRVGVTAVKSIAITFVQFLPYLGLVLAALSAVSAAFTYLKDKWTTKAEKEYNKVMEDFSTILDEANNKIAEYNRLITSSSPEAAISALQIQSNMVAELTKQYNDLRMARQKVYADDEKKGPSTDKDVTKLVSQFRADVGNSLDLKSWFSGLSQQTATGAEALGKISQVSTETTKEFIKMNLQAASAAGSWEESEKILGQTLAIVGSQISSVAMEAENLREAYKNLEDASVKYGQAALVKTSVDDLVKGFDQTNIAILRLQNSFSSGAINAKEFNQALQAVGNTTVTFLGESAARAKIEIESLNSQIESLKKLNSSGLGFEGLGAQIAEMEAARDGRAESFAKILSESLQSTAAITIEYQNQLRVNKQMQAIEQARYAKVKDLFNTGAAGALAQLEHEKKLRDFQIAKIALEKKLVDLQIASMKTQWEFQTQQFKEELSNLREVLSQQEEIYSKARENEISLQNLAVQGLELRYKLQLALARGAFDTFKKLWESSVGRQDKEAEAAAARALAVQKEIDRREEEQRIRGLEHANNMRDIEAASKSLGLEIAAISEQNLSTEERLAVARKAGVELSKKYLEQATEYQKILVSTSQAVIKYNKTILGTTNEILDKREEIIQSYKDQTKSARIAAASEIATLRAELGQAEAQAKNNNLTELGREAANETLRFLRDTLHNKELILKASLNQLDIETRLALIQTAIFDSMTDGVKWQQEAVGMLNQRLELSEKIREAEQGIAASQRRVNRIKRGLPETAESQNNEAIRVATEQLRAAKVSAQIRMSSINAEYALLHAQKEALVAELSARSQILSADKSIDPTFISGLNNAISLLGKVDYKSMAQEAQRATLLGVESARQNLKEVLANANSTTAGDSTVGRYMARILDRQEAKNVKKSATEELNNNPVYTSLIELPTTIAASMETITSSNTAALKETFGAQSQIARDVSAIAEVVTKGGASYRGGLNIQDAGKYAESMGAKVTRQSAWNGGKKITSGHSNGSRHYDDQAIDVNYVKNDAGNASAKAKLDKMAEEFQSRGFRVLWNGTDYSPFNGRSRISGDPHTDHLHAEVPRSVVSTKPSVVPGGPSTVPAAASSTAANAQEAANTYKELTNKYPDRDHGALVGKSRALMEDPGVDQGAINVTAQGVTTLSTKIKEFRADAAIALEPLLELSTKLGPEGEMILAVTSGFDRLGQSMQDNVGIIFGSLEHIKDPMERTAARVTAIGAVISSAITAASGILSAASDAKIRGIDAEIAAEQKRDGQSVASVAKIAELEKRKEAIARKQFNMNKKMMMAQAVIATATGITQALSYGPPGIPLAIAIGALGAVQLALIASTTYQGAASTAKAGKISVPKLTIGRVGDKVNLDRSNTNAGGEIGYLRGTAGHGSSASNYRTIGSAYGGSTARGYGHRAFLVGEKGPETIETSEPMNVKPKVDAEKSGDNYYTIQATDADSFMNLLENNPEAIAKGLKKLANSSGERFLENVDLRAFKATKR